MPSFIQDDEYIILQDVHEHRMTQEDLSACASGGASAALTNFDWYFVEPTPGHYDWSIPDGFVERCAKAGLKALLSTPNCAAGCMPDDWYCWGVNNNPHRNFPEYSVFSPWNAEAQAYQESFIEMIMDRYASYSVQVIRGGAHGGESLLPYSPSYFEPAALESFRAWTNNRFYGNLSAFNKEEGASFPSWESVRPGVFDFYHLNHLPITKLWLKEHLTSMVVRQQQQLVRHYGGEAWLMLAHCWKDVMETGNFLIPEIADVIIERVQPTQVNWIAYAHFNMGSTLQYIALERVKAGNVRLWTGSQYCEGLAVNTDTAISSGIRGFITGPLSLEDSQIRPSVVPWMVENIRNSISKWKAHSELSRSV